MFNRSENQTKKLCGTTNYCAMNGNCRGLHIITDVTDFRARIVARFKIGNAEIDVVFGNVEKPADIYACIDRCSEPWHNS